jgi:hypothetical protein
MAGSAELTIVIPATLRHELEASPFGGVPDWFAVDVISDGVAIVGHSRVGECRLGEAVVYSTHLGESRQVADAVIVDTAHAYADLFVSQDRRARKRYSEIADGPRSLDYRAFKVEVLGLRPGVEGSPFDRLRSKP